ncbi:aldo/keto reductase [Aerococcaceae bacterium WGS1372]
MEEKLLNDGHKIPEIGFGTWQIEEGEEAYQAVTEAINAGYRHIDTAQIYGNEASVGRALSDSEIVREDIYITTKVWNTMTNYEETIKSIEESMEKLQVNYINLVLIHWPNPKSVRENDGWIHRNREVWRALEDLQTEGKIHSIGVSNFMVHHLESLLETARIKPAINQIRLAPGLIQSEVVDYCKEHDIVIEAYSPLGHGTVMESETIKEVAENYLGKSAPQVALRWSLDKGFIPLPKSVTPKHIKSNLNIFDFKLSEQDIERLDKITGILEFRDPDQTNN